MSWQPEKYRPFLKLMARRLCLDKRLKRRFDSSDLVQDTLLKAHQKIDQCLAQEEPQRLKWLHAILVNTARDRLCEEKAARRNLDLEVALDRRAADSSACLGNWLAAEQSSPEEQAERNERLLSVMRAVEELPAEQREVLLMHYLAEESPSAIAAQIGRTPKAVAMLLYRGLKALRQRLHAEE